MAVFNNGRSSVSINYDTAEHHNRLDNVTRMDIYDNRVLKGSVIIKEFLYDYYSTDSNAYICEIVPQISTGVTYTLRIAKDKSIIAIIYSPVIHRYIHYSNIKYMDLNLLHSLLYIYDECGISDGTDLADIVDEMLYSLRYNTFTSTKNPHISALTINYSPIIDNSYCFYKRFNESSVSIYIHNKKIKLVVIVNNIIVSEVSTKDDGRGYIHKQSGTGNVDIRKYEKFNGRIVGNIMRFMRNKTNKRDITKSETNSINILLSNIWNYLYSRDGFPIDNLGIINSLY